MRRRRRTHRPHLVTPPRFVPWRALAGRSRAVVFGGARPRCRRDSIPRVKDYLTRRGRQRTLDTVEIARAALKHGVSEAEIEHAWTHAIRLVEYEYDGEERLLVIGPDQHGRLLAAVPAARPVRIIHADRLRPKFFDCLR